MRKFLFYIFLASVHAFSFGQTKNGYEIDLTINDLPDSTVFLAYHLGDKQYIRDTVRLDGKGLGVFKGQELLPQGIYMIVCLLYTSPSPRDRTRSRMPSSA